jgi:hypothetical protein
MNWKELAVTAAVVLVVLWIVNRVPAIKSLVG